MSELVTSSITGVSPTVVLFSAGANQAVMPSPVEPHCPGSFQALFFEQKSARAESAAADSKHVATAIARQWKKQGVRRRGQERSREDARQ